MFGDDALGYFTQRLDPAPTRAAFAAVLHRAKRNKAFEDCRFVGLALDGTTAGRRRKSGCSLCRPYRNADREILGYRHHLVLAAVVGGDLTLPVDIEPYGPGDSEYAAGQRLLRRLRVNLGARFIDYVVVDGEFATAPFLHACGEVGWPVVARLKDNLPALFQAAQIVFEPGHHRPTHFSTGVQKRGGGEFSVDHHIIDEARSQVYPQATRRRCPAASSLVARAAPVASPAGKPGSALHRLCGGRRRIRHRPLSARLWRSGLAGGGPAQRQSARPGIVRADCL